MADFYDYSTRFMADFLRKDTHFLNFWHCCDFFSSKLLNKNMWDDLKKGVVIKAYSQIRSEMMSCFHWISRWILK